MKSLSALVGMKHRGTERVVAALPEGEPLTLVREPSNIYDRFAVQVWARGEHVGYVKGSQVKPIARGMDAKLAMDSAATFAGKLSKGGERWPMVEIDE